jgi:hypothetical protein
MLKHEVAMSTKNHEGFLIINLFCVLRVRASGFVSSCFKCLFLCSLCFNVLISQIVTFPYCLYNKEMILQLR